MTSVTEALETEVMTIMQLNAAAEGRPSARQRADINRGYRRILKLIAPRIRHFTRQYGLTDQVEDAEQVCAIAVHRAIETYDPAKAKFTTFINWQLRGELQGLRFRLRLDQRSSAKRVNATTVSLESLEGADGMTLDQLMIDEEAEEMTTALASRHMALGAARAMIDGYVDQLRISAIRQVGKGRSQTKVRRRSEEMLPGLPKYIRCKPGTVDPAELAKIEARVARDRAIIEGYLLEEDAAAADRDAPVTRERERQIARRAIRAMAEQVRRNPRFTGENGEGDAVLHVVPKAKPSPQLRSPVMIEDITAEMSLRPQSPAIASRRARLRAH